MTFHHLPVLCCTRSCLLQKGVNTGIRQHVAIYSYRVIPRKQLSKVMNWTDQRLQNKMERHVSKIDRYKQRLKEEVVSSLMSVCVVCTGAKGLAKSVLIKTNHDRYMFNCGETTQKCLVEAVSNLGPVDNIFFTHNSWNNVGGLMGFMLTNNETLVHNKAMTLHGPPNVDKILQMTKMFSENHVGALARVEWRGVAEKTYEDAQITVEYVEIVPEGVAMEGTELEGGAIQEKGLEGGASTAGGGTESDSNTQVDSETDGQEMSDRERKQLRDRHAVAYIITPKVLPRKVDIKKLHDLNVKSGPWVGKLVNLETVKLPDGRVVNPDDVLIEGGNYNNPIVVLECPTLAYLDSLLSSPQLKGLNDSTKTVPELMIHMSPACVTEDPRYKTFIDRYSGETIHLMMNETSAGPFIQGAASLQSSLNLLHPDIFPLLQAHTDLATPPAPPQGNVVTATPGLKYTYRPRSQKGFQWEETLYINQEEALKSVIEEGQNVQEELTKLKAALEQNPVKTGPDEYPEIVFLGTGSAVPGIKRNVSSILLQMRKDEYLLLDCGEGTLAQLYQLYGDHTEHILANLKAVFISHLHYDHHGGLFNIMEKRSEVIGRDGRQDRLLLLAPQSFRKWIGLYNQHVTDVYLQLLLHPHHFLMEYGKRGETTPVMEMVLRTLGVTEYVPVPVRHVTNSHGIVITHEDGWKLVYSGDTMPCEDLVKYGKDCDYLIHEGTFDDSTPDLAYSKNHSTTGEAIDVAKRMGARYLILTHFSQRFSRLPNFTDKFTENVSFAYDFMKLRPSQLDLVPLFKPALHAMYGQELEERKQRAEVKRSMLFGEGIFEERQERLKAKATHVQRREHTLKDSKPLISKLKLTEVLNEKEKSDSVAGPSKEQVPQESHKRKSEGRSDVSKVPRTGDGGSDVNTDSVDEPGKLSAVKSSPNR